MRTAKLMICYHYPLNNPSEEYDSFYKQFKNTADEQQHNEAFGSFLKTKNKDLDDEKAIQSD